MITVIVTFFGGAVVGAVASYLVLRRHADVRRKLDAVVKTVKR
jgi:hypothetical protein